MNIMNKSWLTLLIAGSVLTAGYAECKITVTAQPKLPLPNLIKNSDFTPTAGAWLVAPKSSTGTGFSVEDGKNCLKLVGGKNSQIRQRIAFSPNTAVGAKLFVSFKLKTVNINSHPVLSLQVDYSDGTSAYLPVPLSPDFSHDWLTISKTIQLKKAIKYLTIYCCHYQPIGKSYWRDFVVKVGKINLDCKISGDALKKVKIFSKHSGLIFTSKVLAEGTTTFDKTLPGTPGGHYYIEVSDYAGNMTGKYYPSTAKPATVVTEKIIPVIKRFNSLVCASKKYEKITFELPELNQEKVYLQFTGRISNQYDSLSGYDNSLAIFFNKKPLKASRLIGREAVFTRPDGQKFATQSAKGFVLFFSPWVVALPESHPYHPVDIAEHNPFKFKFDITDLAVGGKNSLIFKNNYKNKIVIDNCQIVIGETK